MANDNEDHGLHSLTAEIVASYVGNQPVAIADLPGLIASVFGALRGLGQSEEETATEPPAPAVPIKKSIGTDYLICLEDGHKVKMLKRYLATRYQLTPGQYRQRWGLPKTYPMVAPAYAAYRSKLSKEMGLGRKQVTPAPSPTPPPALAAPDAGRRAGGRRKKA